MQLDVVLLHQLVLDAVDFGHDGDGRPGVLGPREGNAGQHLLFALQEEITYVRAHGGFLEDVERANDPGGHLATEDALWREGETPSRES